MKNDDTKQKITLFNKIHTTFYFCNTCNCQERRKPPCQYRSTGIVVFYDLDTQRGQNGGGTGFLQRICRRVLNGISGCKAAHSPQWHLSMILDELLWPRTITGPRWRSTYGRHRRSGIGWQGSWDRKGSSIRVLGTFFKAVVYAVLLFGLEIWVINPRMGRALGGFQHRVAQWITGR